MINNNLFLSYLQRKLEQECKMTEKAIDQTQEQSKSIQTKTQKAVDHYEEVCAALK